MIESPTAVRIPELPATPARAGFPVIATVAPVVLSGVMWVVTGSVYMLLFAVLGPVVALASMLDARRGVRKAKGAALAQFEAECADTRARIAALHRQQRHDGWVRTPSVAMIDRGAWRATGSAADVSAIGAYNSAYNSAGSSADNSAGIGDEYEDGRVGDDADDSAADSASVVASLSRWQPDARPLIALGRGTVPSAFAVEMPARGRPDAAAAGSTEPGNSTAPGSTALEAAARSCPDAPVEVDAGSGIGLVGSEILTRSVARGLVLQLAHRLHPGRFAVSAPPGDAWAWTRLLPHASSGLKTGQAFRLGQGHGHAPPDDDIELVVSEDARTRRRDSTHHREFLIALAASSEALPPGCSTIVRIDEPQRASIVRSRGHPTGLRLQPELVSASQAYCLSAQLTAAANDLGFGLATSALPRQIDLHELIDLHEPANLHDPVRLHEPIEPERRQSTGQSPAVSDRSSLRCPIGMGTDGVQVVDLVESGPHAIVAGTTGSGKSELLITWVAALAAGYPADAVNFLLVDFKGGAAFDDLGRLPQCVGVITDLDAAEAGRALESLRAEIRYREETLRTSGARDIAQDRSGCLPRLVIVVDEFQAMLDAFPPLHALFVDLAARGRSLGIHLILCTQRPTGVVRDALLANCSLRLSLRVNSAADSVAILGVDDAVTLDQAEPGRCLIRTGGSLDLCQIATTSSAHIDSIIARAAAPAGVGERHAPRRPWLDPLPDRVEFSELASLATAPTGAPGQSPTALVLGLADEPERQRYSIARYDPVVDGGLLVIGGPGSGRSTLLASLAGQETDALSCTVVAPDSEAMWDALVDAAGQMERRPSAHRSAGASGAPRTLLLFDDVDAIYATWGSEHQDAARELWGDILRRGPAVGLHIVLALGQLTPALQRIGALCPSTLVLGGASTADLVAAEVRADLQDQSPRDADGESSGRVPGAARWRGRRIQLLAVHVPAVRDPAVHDPVHDPKPRDIRELARKHTAWPIRLADERNLVVVSGRLAATCAHLRARAPAGTMVSDISRSSRADSDERMLRVADQGTAGEILVGDVEAWQSQWALFTALRRTALVVLDHCTLADVRVLTRGRIVPPHIAQGRDHVWILQPDGSISRGVFAESPV